MEINELCKQYHTHMVRTEMYADRNNTNYKSSLAMIRYRKDQKQQRDYLEKKDVFSFESSHSMLLVINFY